MGVEIGRCSRRQTKPEPAKDICIEYTGRRFSIISKSHLRNTFLADQHSSKSYHSAAFSVSCFIKNVHCSSRQGSQYPCQTLQYLMLIKWSTRQLRYPLQNPSFFSLPPLSSTATNNSPTKDNRMDISIILNISHDLRRVFFIRFQSLFLTFPVYKTLS
jgi:hypothetical protein